MASDVLKQLSEKQVQGWYERLGRKVSADAKTAGVSSPLSGAFLLQYIGKNGNALGAVLDVDAPEHLQADSSVIDVQLFHRAVFLTETKGNFRPQPDRWAGLIPRLQSGKWDGASTISLEYASLSDVAPGPVAIAKLYATKPAGKWDIFTSLRGWQLKSSVRVAGKPNGDKVAITFESWSASGEDYYDFDANEHLTVPNPDYQSKESYAVAPKEREIRVYHSNAIRLEKVGLAQPFKVRVKPWLVKQASVTGAAEIDPKKKLS